MDSTARHNLKPKILITNISSYLGEKLAEYLLGQNCQIYGVAKSKVPENLITNPDFTLLDISINQPIPTHIASFDQIIHITNEQKHHDNQAIRHLSPHTTNIIHTATTQNIKLALVAPLFQDTQIFENHLNSNTDLFLIGDIYGPQTPHITRHADSDLDPFSQNKLSIMVSQATTEDKLILEKEGQEIVYPTYIDDALHAIHKIIFENSQKRIHYIVSESPKSTLAVGYEIQNSLNKVASKDIKLYFAGASMQTAEPEPSLRIPELNFHSKVGLVSGLEIIFNDALQNGQIKHSNSQNQLQSSQQEQSHQDLPTAIGDPLNSLKKPASSSISFRSHKVLLLLILVAVLFTAKVAFDLTYGFKNLKSTQDLLKSGDFEKAFTNAKNADHKLTSAKSIINFISTPYTLIFPKKTGFSNSLDTAIFSSKAILNIADGSRILSANLSAIVQTDVKKDVPRIDDAQASLQKAFFESSQALSFARQAQSSKYLNKYVNPKIELIQKLNLLALNTYEFTYLIKDITGSTDPKTYLILLQNNTELRPGGGFIGNYGTMSFTDGYLKEIKVDDIYQIDGQLKEKIEPPKQLKDKLGVDNFYLRDSNWVPDFAVNAQTARDFYKKETGQNVDGVIAIDLYFIQNILKITGPIKLSDYNEEISADNLFERGEYHAEIGFFPGSTQKKDFFSSLTRALIAKVTDSITGQKKDNFSLVSLAQSFGDSLSQKHLMLALDSPNLSTYTKSKGWGNTFPPQNFDPADDSYETRDFLSISEANVGANKVNNELERKISYDLTVGRDADLVAKLKIIYINKSQANTWPGGTYVNFLRLYVPFGATPSEVKNNDKTDIKDIQVTNQNKLTIFSTFVEVPIKSTREFTLTYRIPKNIKLEKAPTYHVYFQKQPGTDRDQLNFNFNLPNYLAVKSINSSENQQGKQNISIQTDLLEDRQFTIDISKK